MLWPLENFFKQNSTYMIRTKNVILRPLFQLNFHIQNVIYRQQQEKELLQSWADNLSELWHPSSNLYPSCKSWGSFVPLCTEMQHIPFPHASSPVGSFLWAKNWHWVLKSIVLPAWQALRETPNRYCCYHKFSLLSRCSLFSLIIPV